MYNNNTDNNSIISEGFGEDFGYEEFDDEEFYDDEFEGEDFDCEIVDPDELSDEELFPFFIDDYSRCWYSFDTSFCYELETALIDALMDNSNINRAVLKAYASYMIDLIWHNKDDCPALKKVLYEILSNGYITSNDEVVNEALDEYLGSETMLNIFWEINSPVFDNLEHDKQVYPVKKVFYTYFKKSIKKAAELLILRVIENVCKKLLIIGPYYGYKIAKSYDYSDIEDTYFKALAEFCNDKKVAEAFGMNYVDFSEWVENYLFSQYQFVFAGLNYYLD